MHFFRLNDMVMQRLLTLCSILLGSSFLHAADFLETFDGPEMIHDTEARAGWAWMTGDGEATMTFLQAEGSGLIQVDARADHRNIWWAFIRRSISSSIDQNVLARADRELRVEAKIRASVAPRRVNLHFNHSRTTDYHSHLMEFDIPDTENWHVISMTTSGFDARPGDEVFVQMALMDWGRDQYTIEIDYIGVQLVDPATVEPDLGSPLHYRPATLPPEAFANRIPASQDATIDSAWPHVNYHGWMDHGSGTGRPLIAVGGSQLALIRWDLETFAGLKPVGWGALQLTTDRVYRTETGLEEFGGLRIVEILGGDAGWTREMVTYEKFLDGEHPEAVFNGQMVIDVEPAVTPGGKTMIAISPPTLQRLLTGRTKGLAVYEQGAISATFISGASDSETDGPYLLFNLE